MFHSRRASKGENYSELFQIQLEDISFLKAFVFKRHVNSRKLLVRSGYPYHRVRYPIQTVSLLVATSLKESLYIYFLSCY